jgi:hypothetical protein
VRIYRCFVGRERRHDGEGGEMTCGSETWHNNRKKGRSILELHKQKCIEAERSIPVPNHRGHERAQLAMLNCLVTNNKRVNLML